MWLPYVCFAVCFAVRPRHACPVLLFGCLAASWCLSLNLSCACLCLFPFQLPHAVSPPATSRHTTHAFPLWLAITRFSYQRPGLLLSGLGVVLAGWSVVCSGLWAGFARVARCMNCLQYGIGRAGGCVLAVACACCCCICHPARCRDRVVAAALRHTAGHPVLFLSRFHFGCFPASVGVT